MAESVQRPRCRPAVSVLFVPFSACRLLIGCPGFGYNARKLYQIGVSVNFSD